MALYYCIVSEAGALGLAEIPAPSVAHVDRKFLDSAKAPPLAARAEDLIKSEQDELANVRIPLKLRRSVLSYLTSGAEMRFPVSKNLDTATKSIEVRRGKAKHVPEIMRRIARKVEQGARLADALSLYPGFADEATVGIISAGEGTRNQAGSGSMAESLKQAGLLLDQKIRFRTAIVRSVFYPMILLLFAIGLVTFLMVKILPTFADLFSELGGNLPWETRLVMNVSDFTVDHWGWVTFGFIGTIFLLRSIAPTLRRMRWSRPHLIFRLHSFMLRVKGLGRLLKLNQEISLCRVLIALQRARKTQTESLALAQGLSENLAYRASIARIRKAIHDGESLGSAIEREKGTFTIMFVEAMRMASETGQGEKHGEEGIISKYLTLAEEEFTTATQALETFMLPVILLMVAIPIALIACACLHPLFMMSDLIKP